MIAIVGDSLDKDPLTYPTCKIKGKFFYLDVYRSFIQFMALVNEYLKVSSSNKNWDITDYLGEEYLKGAGYTHEKGIE